VISLNLVLAGLRLGLKNRQVGEKWVNSTNHACCVGEEASFRKGNCFFGHKHAIPFGKSDEDKKPIIIMQFVFIVGFDWLLFYVKF
jgi:hypothetical protein